MRSNYLKTLKTAVLAISVLLLGASVSFAQQVYLTAGAANAPLPDGSSVPMWGYTCSGAVVAPVTCSALNPNAGTGWSPIVITTPPGSLTINLTNNLTFAAGANNIPTSLVIVGQLGGGLGVKAQRTTAPSPQHLQQGTTWPIAGDNSGAVFNPPPQDDRVQSFASEVAVGTPQNLVWSNLRPGTYLIESGTHPSIQGPMGLYGILVVTTAPSGTTAGQAYPGVSYGAEVPLLMSEIDPAQNTAVQTAVNTVGFKETATHTMADGVAVAVTNGGSGYTSAPTVTFAGGGGSGAAATAVIDTTSGSPTFGQVIAINVTNRGTGYTSNPSVILSGGGGTGAAASATLVLVGGAPCGTAAACYPPAVNYTPLYYLINGQAFNKTNAMGSLFAALPNPAATGGVLVRMVNAGLRMHVPSIVGSMTTPAKVPTGVTAAAVPGFSLVAEDGNPLPGVSRVQSEVFMAAGKTYDVMIDAPAACVPVPPATTCTSAPALPIFDRELSLSSNSIGRDGGMLAYIGINGATLPTTGAFDTSAAAKAAAIADTYNSLIAGQTLTISDPAKGVIANDVNVYGVQVLTAPTGGTLKLNSNGTFTYAPNAGTTSDSFTYCANGTVSGTPATCSSGLTAMVTIGPATLEAGTGITCAGPFTYTSNVATTLSIKPPGVLSTCKDAAGYPLTVDPASITSTGFTTLSVDANGGFNAIVPSSGTYTFNFTPKNSQGTTGSTSYKASITFQSASGLVVNVLDGTDKTTKLSDYRWIIEEDRTFYINPFCTTNPPPAGCPTQSSGIVPTFGTNFHTSYMPVVAAGCTGPLSCESGQTLLGVPAVCDQGNGVCHTDAAQQATLTPDQVHLDPTKRYYISVLPGDAANSFENVNNCLGNATPSCGHGMGGAPIACALSAGSVTCTANSAFPAVNVLVQPNPFPPSKLSVFVFEDDFPLNGEQDGGGGIDVLSPNEPGLGGFNIKLFDDAGGSGDATGQMSYDMFNMPLSNSLAGTLDPETGLDACPISAQATASMPKNGGDGSQLGITGEIVTCPRYEADGTTLSPLAGQAVVANLMPGRYGVVATPAADRIARGEEWLQTNTLDGQKAHDSFLRIGEPSFFQEYGPAGFHVSIGFANPAIINARRQYVCDGTDANITGTNCTNAVTGVVTTERMSRTPDERLYSSGDNSSFAFTQCYVSFGDADGMDFAFTKCASDGSFSLSGLPDGDWRITVFDQWNDMLVDGLSTPIRLAGGNTVNLGQIAVNQWQANIYTKTFFDLNNNGIQDGTEPGLTLVATNIRFRDGSYSNFNNTDLSGNAGFNEVFPLFSWYVVETDTTRYKSTGVHVVYDAGGPADTSFPVNAQGTQQPCPAGQRCTNIGGFLANSGELVSLPAALRVPGARYCAQADCLPTDTGFTAPTAPPYVVASASTGRVDPPYWFGTEGWQGFSGQNSFLEFGKKPFVAGETGGIHGEVIYASTRPFDDPALLIHTSWTPDVPNVTINLYQEGTAPDGSQSLTLVDTTKTSSWDDWAQGFRSDGIPNMNCPGQGGRTGTNADLFFFSLFNQPMWLDMYNHGGSASNSPTNWYNAQFKCYDGMHNWNQLQPAPYDGMYSFPSVTSLDPATGKPAGTNCTICVVNPDTADPYRRPTTTQQAGTLWTPSLGGSPMLPPGKYVVEVVVPPGYELVKEEDKNILIGDNYIAPATQQFAGLGNIFILPDQAEISALYNANNPQNPTQTLGRTTFPSSEGDTGSVEVFWPCVGALRTVPDFISLFPQSGEVAPFAGAQRHLCDRKEVTLNEQMSALAKFWVFSSTHVAAHFTGVITDDYTSEFDPFSPQFGEKFSPPDLPISIKDWTGTEISRTYADHWGTYDGLNYSTWEVNPPNPTGYAPTMMITCMNDPGPIPDPNNAGQMITDPLYNPQYSQFCYEIPFMPGQTQYMDTPVTPTSAFAGAGYNNPDCAYPNLTPAIKEVDGEGIGPWVSAAGKTITITALGDVAVNNNAYSGPAATGAPYNQKTILRHYGFGNTAGTVTVGGVPLTNVSWSDTSITGTVNLSGVVNGQNVNVPACAIQQQAVFGGSNANCGQLVITTAGGQASIDTVTVTIGGKAPTHVAASASIQAAIDAAKPGDLLMIDPTCTITTGAGAAATTTVAPSCTTAGVNGKTSAAHTELLLMWKPVRLQGVGAASSVINANTHPAGKLNDWRARVDCLFGLGPDGSPKDFQSSCGSGWLGFNPTTNNPQVDRLPLEATVGWQASLNGNLAELLQEPSLMGALEGAAITVLSKGAFFPSNPFDSTLLAGFPDGSVLFKASNNNKYCPGGSVAGGFTSNFWCNPSSIDGLTVTDSSQGGGGIFVHGWGHNIQIANNRVQNNAGTLSGGINVGQGEFPPSYIQGGTTNAAPGSCQTRSFSNRPNSQLPYCHDLNVNVHHNYISFNSSTGDELFSATPAGAGGISFCTGSDYYKFNYNWVCGNLSTGDGGGLGHLGFSYNGDIEHNAFLFNQSTNPTIATNGGAMVIQGAPDVDPTCGANTDQDCVPSLTPVATIGPSDGTGPGLVINANLILGNQAESGSGGGIALQQVNGSDVVAFPNSHCGGNSNNDFNLSNCAWNTVSVTNNIIVNNVAGWDGGGVSLLDSLAVNFVNNTVMHNDSTASSGVLFNTIGAPLASTQGSNCIQQGTTTASCPQVGGLVSIDNSAVLQANLRGVSLTCPAGHGASGLCAKYSIPLLYNDLFWQNRSYYIGVAGVGAGTLNQQNQVALYNAFGPQTTANLAPTQTHTGDCNTASYWDIGVRGDTGPASAGPGNPRLSPAFSFLSSGGYGGSNSTNDPAVTKPYCNGSRIPPEFQNGGWQVPPGISDATVPNPIFNLTPVATVDEGNNWINISWGPLALMGPTGQATGAGNADTFLGNYTPTSASPTTNYIPLAGNNGNGGAYNLAPGFDFYGNPRKTNNAVDAGAVEFQGAAGAPVLSVTGGPLAFGNQQVGTTSGTRTLTLHNTGTGAATGISVVVATTSNPTTPNQFAQAGGTCGATLAANSTCTITVSFSPTSTGGKTGTVTITANAAVTGSPVSLSGTGVTAIGSVTGGPLAFGNVPLFSTSGSMTLTLHNTGNASLTGITLAFSSPRFFRPTGAAAGSCGGTLAAGATCTINVRFRPIALGLVNGTVTITGIVPISGSPVSLSGTGVASAVSIAPDPLTITVNRGFLSTGTGTVTLTNTSAASITINNVVVSGGSFFDYMFTIATGQNHCTGALAAGASCTVGVQFTDVFAGSGDYPGTVTFTDTATGSPHTGDLVGHIN
jgi:hypothetical protein